MPPSSRAAAFETVTMRLLDEGVAILQPVARDVGLERAIADVVELALLVPAAPWVITVLIPATACWMRLETSSQSP